MLFLDCFCFCFFVFAFSVPEHQTMKKTIILCRSQNCAITSNSSRHESSARRVTHERDTTSIFQWCSARSPEIAKNKQINDFLQQIWILCLRAKSYWNDERLLEKNKRLHRNTTQPDKHASATPQDSQVVTGLESAHLRHAQILQDPDHPPISSALKATGLLLVHNNLLASTFISMRSKELAETLLQTAERKRRRKNENHAKLPPSGKKWVQILVKQPEVCHKRKA